jgi:branched-chain amino acid transport system ATP-binding protein
LVVLTIKNIYKSFGEQQVLRGLNLNVESGTIHTLVGGNGSGKTTLFNLITGFLRSDSGEISFKEKRIDKKSPVTINTLGITRTFQDLRVITQITVKENILLSFKNNPGEIISNAVLPPGIFKNQYKVFAEKASDIIEKIHLKGVKDNLAGEISYGQQKLLTVGCCIANDANLLLLDEPIAGIDEDNYKRIYDLILLLKSQGKTILQIEHNRHFVESLTDVIWFMNEGKATRFDSYESFKSDEIVKKVYMN